MIFIQSAPQFVSRRNVIRSTWISGLSDFPEIKPLFIFGQVNPDEVIDPEVEAEMMIEKEQLCDFVQFDYIDSYAVKKQRY